MYKDKGTVNQNISACHLSTRIYIMYFKISQPYLINLSVIENTLLLAGTTQVARTDDNSNTSTCTQMEPIPPI